MSEQVLEALRQLDAADDTHWTSAGDPSLELVRQVSGVAELSRKALTEIAPTLKRATYDEWLNAAPDAAPKDDDQPAVEEPKYDKAELDAAIVALDDRIAEQKLVVNVAQRELVDLVKEQDMLRDTREKAFPKPAAVVYAQEHIRRQQEIRAERLGKTVPNERDALTPLERALMSRPNQQAARAKERARKE